DRRRLLYLVWGSVVAGFSLNAALGAVQISGQSEGLFGFIVPGRAPAWAPSTDDLLESPASASLRRLATLEMANAPAFEKIALVPDRQQFVGTMIGGSGGLLAMGSMALPAGFAIVLHLLAPRGSRERLVERLGHSGLGGLTVLLGLLLVVGA